MYRIFGMEPQSQEITFDLLIPFLPQKDKDLFERYNLKKYKLGETTLRAETAAIVAGYKLLWN